MTRTPLPSYQYNGARAMVGLHDDQLREFLAVWRKAKTANLQLPQTDDPDYASLETLLRHVVGCARGYMVWMCQALGLPDPDINPTPDAETLAPEVGAIVEHVTERWKKPLAQVPEKRFNEVYPSSWKVEYCIDAMLEHAVMHPIRHTRQLNVLLNS